MTMILIYIVLKKWGLCNYEWIMISDKCPPWPHLLKFVIAFWQNGGSISSLYEFLDFFNLIYKTKY